MQVRRPMRSRKKKRNKWEVVDSAASIGKWGYSPEAQPAIGRWARVVNKMKPMKLEVVVVHPVVGSSYADVARLLKIEIDVDVPGVCISRMVKSKDGEVVLLLEKGPRQRPSAEILRDAARTC